MRGSGLGPSGDETREWRAPRQIRAERLPGALRARIQPQECQTTSWDQAGSAVRASYPRRVAFGGPIAPLPDALPARLPAFLGPRCANDHAPAACPPMVSVSVLRAWRCDAPSREAAHWVPVKLAARYARPSPLARQCGLQRALHEPRQPPQRPRVAPLARRHPGDSPRALPVHRRRARWPSGLRCDDPERRVWAPPSAEWRGSAGRLRSIRRGHCLQPANRRSSRHEAILHRPAVDRCANRRPIRYRGGCGPIRPPPESLRTATSPVRHTPARTVWRRRPDSVRRCMQW